MFLPGDYIQLGSSSTSTLHKVLTQTNGDSGGNATLDLFPAIRVAPADNAVITVASCAGKFRLSTNLTQWEINNISSYGMNFDCMQAT